jgi:hypothetical protein
VGQAAISDKARRQPAHVAVASSIRQMPVQGEGGSSMASCLTMRRVDLQPFVMAVKFSCSLKQS